MTSLASDPNFFDARLREQKTVSVGGRPVLIRTFSFFRHVNFEKFRKEYFKCALDKKTSPKARYEKFVDLLNASGIDWSDAEPEELPNIFEAVIRVNKLPPFLAWQDTSDIKDKKKDVQATMEDNTHYDGRDVASTVALLSSEFGWTADYILENLSLYEVNCYVQEALLIQHKRQEMYYNFAEIGFKKVGDSYEKVPYPDPPWVKKTSVVVPEQMKNTEVPRRFQPDGYIVDFTKKGQDGRAVRYTLEGSEKEETSQKNTADVE